LLEHFLAVLAQIDVADFDRARLGKPNYRRDPNSCLLEAVDHAALENETWQVTPDSRVLDRLDDDVAPSQSTPTLPTLRSGRRDAEQNGRIPQRAELSPKLHLALSLCFGDHALVCEAHPPGFGWHVRKMASRRPLQNSGPHRPGAAATGVFLGTSRAIISG
jgi:hypothetical protein